MLQVVGSNPSLTTGYSRFSFRLFYLDPTPRPGPQADGPARYSSRELGTVLARDLTLDAATLNPRSSSLRTLDDHRFVIGDILSVAALSGNTNAPLLPGAGPAPGAMPPGPGGPLPPSRSAPVGLDSLRPGFSIRGRGSAQGLANRPGDRASWANGDGNADRWGRGDGPPRGRRDSDAAGEPGWRRRRDSRSRSPPVRSGGAPQRGDANGMQGW